MTYLRHGAMTGMIAIDVIVSATGIEPFPTWLCLAELQYVDGLGEFPRAPGAAAELFEDVPGLELCVCPLAGGTEFRVRPVGLFLGVRLVPPLVRDLRPGTALIALVRKRD